MSVEGCIRFWEAMLSHDRAFLEPSTIALIEETIKHLKGGLNMVCANHKNQIAIDTAIREANERLMRIDKASGMADPKPMYSLGNMRCDECADAGNPDIWKDMFDKTAGGESGFHRICYQEAKRQ